MQQNEVNPINPRILTDRELADYCLRFIEERGYLPILFQLEISHRYASKVN